MSSSYETTTDLSAALRIRLCADEIILVTIDARTGRLNMRDTGDLAAVGRSQRFTALNEKINENPTLLSEALIRLRSSVGIIIWTTIWCDKLGLDYYGPSRAKSQVLGIPKLPKTQFPSRRQVIRFLSRPQFLILYNPELRKLGPSTGGTLFIQLTNFPNHYLVLVITDERFRYALITTKVLTDSMYASMVMEDIAWLDLDRIGDVGRRAFRETEDPSMKVAGQRRKQEEDSPGTDDSGSDL